jgi:hypothetical protein
VQTYKNEELLHRQFVEAIGDPVVDVVADA